MCLYILHIYIYCIMYYYNFLFNWEINLDMLASCGGKALITLNKMDGGTLSSHATDSIRQPTANYFPPNIYFIYTHICIFYIYTHLHIYYTFFHIIKSIKLLQIWNNLPNIHFIVWNITYSIQLYINKINLKLN